MTATTLTASEDAASTAEDLGLRPIEEFREAAAVWPRGRRLEALRDAAQQFRHRFKRQGTVRAVRTADVVAAPYETRLAFGGAAWHLFPYVYLINRVTVIEYEDFGGRIRRLAWEPTVAEGSREAPYYAQMAKQYGTTMTRLGTPTYRTLEGALSEFGVGAHEIDYMTHDHLHVQDLRPLLGNGTPEHRPIFPRAQLICQRKEYDTFRSIHPMQWAWYVPGATDGVDESRIVEIDGDHELGVGVALIATPGHTDGNQSLCINTPDGVWVSSENGVAADSWQPDLSRIPGLKRYWRHYRREVVMNSNTLEDSIDQYDSMVKEKALADRSPRDDRWLNILPSIELARYKVHWPVVPTFFHGGINHGRLTPTEAGSATRDEVPAA